MKRSITTVIAVLPAIALAICASVQAAVPFTVLSPQNGQVVHPGDTLQVLVQPNPGVTLLALQLISSIQSVAVQPVVPIPIVVPSKPVGPVKLSIMGASTTGAGGEIDVTIDIEPSAPPTSIRLSPSALALVARNTSTLFPSLYTSSVRLFGQYPDGSQMDITGSSQVSYSLDNLKVATVDGAGNVTAVLPGKCSITATYAGLTALTTVTVNVFPQVGDLDGDGDVDQDDLKAILTALNTSSTGPGDPRDLNGDGRIDALDARILVTLCSRPHCATK